MQKHYFLIAIAAVLAMSCEKEVVTNQLDDVTYAKISLAGDYVGITSEPLTKANENEAYYGFVIDSLHVEPYTQNYKTYYDSTWVFYAEGLFDHKHISNLTVALKNGNKYRLRCGVIKDGKDKLYVDAESNLYEPFASSRFGYGNKAHLSNTFIYGGKQTLWTELGINGWATVNNNESVRYPELDRYFGEALSEGDPIVINMVRWNFGLRFIFNPPTEGQLRIYHNYSSPQFDFTLNPEDKSINEEHVYMLDSGYNANTHTSSFADIYLKVEWKHADGSIVDLSPETIRVYNKTMTTIKVDINQRATSSDISLNFNGNMTQTEVSIH